MSFFIIKSFHSIPINAPPCIKASPLYPLSMRLKKSPLSSASSIVQPEGTGSFRSVKQCAKIRSPTCKDCSSSSLSTTRSNKFSYVAVENRVEIAFTLVVVLGAELDPLVMVGILLGWCYCIRGAQFSATDIKQNRSPG